jgi:hypothetical protein
VDVEEGELFLVGQFRFFFWRKIGAVVGQRDVFALVELLAEFAVERVPGLAFRVWLISREYRCRRTNLPRIYCGLYWAL